MIHKDTYNKFFKGHEILKVEQTLHLISGGRVDIIGYISILVRTSKHDTDVELNLTVIESKKYFTPLLGRSWLDNLFVGWRNHFVNSTEESLEQENPCKSLLEKYKGVFNKKTTPIKKFKARIVCEENSTPFGMTDVVEKELDRLVAEGIIYPVRHSK